MRKIIIGFSHSTKSFAPFSWAIRAWDNVPYSHVYFKFHSDKHNMELIYQASSTMLNYMSEQIFLGFNEIVDEVEIEVTDEQYDIVMGNCLKSAGLKYGVWQVFGVVIAEVFHLNHNPLANEDQYVCSEWVGEQLQNLGYHFKKPLDLLKPVDIYKEIKKAR